MASFPCATRARLMACAAFGLLHCTVPADARVVGARDPADPQDDIIVNGERAATAHKAQAPTVVDTIVYDDLESIAADGNVAEQLRLLPGISTVDDADAPRFVTIRGVSPNLNQTTIDGVTLASIGSSGEGSRMINMQIIPSELAQRMDVYKTFTAKQDGAAIGGIADILSRSALGLRKRYTSLDVYPTYQSFRGPDGSNTVGGSAQHWGGGAKGVYANRFGANGQFGITVSARYQNRTRNSAKWWQPAKQYFDTRGRSLVSPDAGGWDGRAVPGDHSYGSYTNRVQTAGSSVKLEWRAPEGLRASLLGFGYRLWESSTMNKNDFYMKSIIVSTTPTGGRSQVNSIYSKFRYDTWDRKTYGGIFALDWSDSRSTLGVRGGHTIATYDNIEPYVGVRTYPAKFFLDWENGSPATGGIPRVVGLNDPSIIAKSTYKLSTATIARRTSREDLSDIRIDYGWNAEPEDRGIGVATGIEFRTLDLRRDDTNTLYKLGRVMNDYMVDSGYMPVGAITPYRWIDYRRAGASLWSKLALDKVQTAYQSRIGDYRYTERLWTPYLSLRYRTGTTELIAGARYDDIGFDSYQPVVRGGVVVPGTTRSRGGYHHVLPSFNAMHDLPDGTKLRFAYSRTLGRPTPGDIAQPRVLNCRDGDEDAGGGESSECSVRQGNPKLRPRRSDNLDFGAEYYFGKHGVLGFAAFAKWIKDDIYVLRSFDEVDGVVMPVRQPMNAEGSRLFGAEFQIAQRDVAILGRKVDPFFNVTLLDGRMRVITETGRRTLDRLMYQPVVTISGGATMRLPEIKGAFRATVNHRSSTLNAIGIRPSVDTGTAPQTTVNAALWHQVLPHVTFKYELNNVFNDQPKFLTGNRLQYVSQIDTYGRVAFFHIVIN